LDLSLRAIIDAHRINAADLFDDEERGGHRRHPLDNRATVQPINSIRLEQTMAERVGRGSLTGRWKPRQGACPNIRGGITIERDLPAKTRLWITGWTKTIAGGEFVSLLVEIAIKGGRPPTNEARIQQHE
jgi:hypothetical protein